LKRLKLVIAGGEVCYEADKMNDYSTQMNEVDEQFSKKCADTAGGAIDYDPFNPSNNRVVIEGCESIYNWDPENDEEILCTSQRTILTG
jgi:hypothetical protein